MLSSLLEDQSTKVSKLPLNHPFKSFEDSETKIKFPRIKTKRTFHLHSKSFQLDCKQHWKFNEIGKPFRSIHKQTKKSSQNKQNRLKSMMIDITKIIKRTKDLKDKKKPDLKKIKNLMFKQTKESTLANIENEKENNETFEEYSKQITQESQILHKQSTNKQKRKLKKFGLTPKKKQNIQMICNYSSFHEAKSFEISKQIPRNKYITSLKENEVAEQSIEPINKYPNFSIQQPLSSLELNHHFKQKLCKYNIMKESIMKYDL